MTNKPRVFAYGEITIVTAASEGVSTEMAVSEYLALEKIRKGEIFEGDRNRKYIDAHLAMLS